MNNAALRTLFLTLVLATALTPLGARAATPSPGSPPAAPGAVVVDVEGECPTREAVTAALAPALAPPTGPLAAAPIRVSDLGDGFEVTAAGQTREYNDAARDCAERARTAAVYISLSLNPPSFEPPRAEPPVEKVVAPAPPPPPPPRDTRDEKQDWGDVGIAARVDGGGTGDASTAEGAAAGLELRGAVGRRAFGLGVSAAILTARETTLSAVIVSQQRFPTSITAWWRHTLSPGVEVGAAGGLALVPFTLHGQGFARSTPATRVDLGARLAAEVRFPLGDGGFAPFLGVHVEYFPRAYELDAEPLGALGSTGRAWVGATAGVRLEGRR